MTPIQEVAKKAGVSVATVSRVLNNQTGVKEETRAKVLEAIEALNYRPNLSGRFLRRNETRLVLVLLPTISNPFYAKAIKGIQRVADKNGYLVMICNSESEPEKEIEFLNLAKNRLADGVIIMSQDLPQDKLRQFNADIPIVQCFEYYEDESISYVSIDNEKAAFEAVQYLIGLGHKRIGMIGVSATYQSACQRENGYRRALRDAHCTVDEAIISHGLYGFKSGYESANQILASEQRPTAIFVISDAQAIGAMKAIQRAGLKVPDDISVIGFDNISFSSMYSPSLSTVSQPTYKIGEKAMEILVERMDSEKKLVKHLTMKHSLIIRESTVELKHD